MKGNNLLLPITQIISPIVGGDFRRRILPWLELFVFFLVDSSEMMGIASYEVGRPEYLIFWMSSAMDIYVIRDARTWGM